mgnify:CR=1 FL=1
MAGAIPHCRNAAINIGLRVVVNEGHQAQQVRHILHRAAILRACPQGSDVRASGCSCRAVSHNETTRERLVQAPSVASESMAAQAARQDRLVMSVPYGQSTAGV